MDKTLSYLNGFNDGYIIRKNHPLLFKKLISGVKAKNPYFDGYEAGGKQYEKEIKKLVGQLKSENIIRNKNKDSGYELQ